MFYAPKLSNSFAAKLINNIEQQGHTKEVKKNRIYPEMHSIKWSQILISVTLY